AGESQAAAAAVGAARVAPGAPGSGVPVWLPTHVVPPSGMAAWDAPDPSRPPLWQLSGSVELVVETTAGEWAGVRAVNGWWGWVDGRMLVSRR
ncbi:MAG: hypothetical protein ABSB75_08715, partial [Candidatus Limnocylindrales bacterium]